MIERFDGMYKFLSNFYMTPIEYEGLVYPSSEHAFQAAKTLSEKERLRFMRFDRQNIKVDCSLSVLTGK